VCELLVRVQDKPLSGDLAVDCRRTMRGDVVVAMPDGHDWTPTERSNPEWVIVKVPDMGLAEGRALASHEPSDGLRRHLRKRLFHLDPDLLPKAGDRLESVTIEASELRLAKRRKPPVQDPDVIGPHTHSNIIG
jgi:hypothetical protein